jgi:hypothetical protein
MSDKARIIVLIHNGLVTEVFCDKPAEYDVIAYDMPHDQPYGFGQPFMAVDIELPLTLANVANYLDDEEMAKAALPLVHHPWNH